MPPPLSVSVDNMADAMFICKFYRTPSNRNFYFIHNFPQISPSAFWAAIGNSHGNM